MKLSLKPTGGYPWACDQALLFAAARGLMNLPAESRRLRSIVDITWIISENWLNYVEYHDRELTVEAVAAGYDEILEVLRPYLVADPQRVTSESYSTIERLTAQPLARRGLSAARARARTEN